MPITARKKILEKVLAGLKQLAVVNLCSSELGLLLLARIDAKAIEDITVNESLPG